MHILMLLLSAIGGIFCAVYYLRREGFDFDSLNPFLWRRRANWRKHYEREPLHTLNSPLEVAAVLMLATAKAGGELSVQQKQLIQKLMREQMNCSNAETEQLFTSSSHLLRDKPQIEQQVKPIVAPCKDQFTSEQINSLIQLLNTVADCEGEPNNAQLQLIAAVQQALMQPATPQKW